MQRSLRQWLPEIGLTALALFFIFRELGTFPTPWGDDSLFMIVARNIAEGHGYALPVLGESWQFPYILAVGPTLLWPVALSMKLFGATVVAARLPMALFLLLTTVVTYAFTLRIADRSAARFATLLLVTFSAFVNTGKPVLGEIPAFLFLLFGLFLLLRTPSWQTVVLAGICIGLSVVTKLTFGISIIALGIVWILLIARQNWQDVWNTTLTGFAALVTLLLFGPILGLTDPGFLGELQQYAIAESGSGFLNVLRTNPSLLLRLPFLAFGTILFLGSCGLWQTRRRLSSHIWLLLWVLIGLFIFYFLNNSGWYRHLLPAHLLLLPFVPLGAEHLMGRRAAAGVLTLIAILQGLWQFDHRGATRTTENTTAATILAERYAERDLVIIHPELFFLLPENPRWLFLSEELQLRTYARFEHLPLKQEQHCLPLVQKLNEEQQKEFPGRTEKIHGRYHIIRPPKSCAKFPLP